MFKKILIANRGEIAMRILRTCKEMGIASVAVYSKADQDSLHVSFADEAVCIGPAASKDSYLDQHRIISVAEITNADAIHPGYGFLSENASFSEMCSEHNIKFIGPSGEMISRMGDKAEAKKLMRKIGVPVVPGSEGLVGSYRDAASIGKDLGYPVLIKATAGGGGKGMRVVEDASAMRFAWEEAQKEAEAAFGNPDVYIEKYIVSPRHIEIQVVGDNRGQVCHLSERDCSIQRKHQKLIEESPSVFVDSTLREKMGNIAIKAAENIKYEGCGTVEFICDESGNFYFMEMNTRIQVEHPVTEEVTGFDLIKEQIKVAYGEEISGKNYYPQMHAIECRVNAEDVSHGFRPCPGRIEHLHLPGGHGVRVDTHVYSGYVIPPYYDSMIAKLIVMARSRAEAILCMRRSLDEFIIEGIRTTIPLHRRIMRDSRFLNGDFTTRFLDDFDFRGL